MKENFKLEIISPEKIIFSGEVKMVTVPSYEGDMSFLNDHISTIAFLRPGIIKVKKEENSFEIFFISKILLVNTDKQLFLNSIIPSST